jgi:hypothetical protein
MVGPFLQLSCCSLIDDGGDGQHDAAAGRHGGDPDGGWIIATGCSYLRLFQLAPSESPRPRTCECRIFLEVDQMRFCVRTGPCHWYMRNRESADLNGR